MALSSVRGGGLGGISSVFLDGLNRSKLPVYMWLDASATRMQHTKHSRANSAGRTRDRGYLNRCEVAFLHFGRMQLHPVVSLYNFAQAAGLFFLVFKKEQQAIFAIRTMSATRARTISFGLLQDCTSQRVLALQYPSSCPPHIVCGVIMKTYDSDKLVASGFPGVRVSKRTARLSLFSSLFFISHCKIRVAKLRPSRHHSDSFRFLLVKDEILAGFFRI